MKKIIDGELVRFIIVGLFNTFLGMVTMFGFYHLGIHPKLAVKNPA